MVLLSTVSSLAPRGCLVARLGRVSPSGRPTRSDIPRPCRVLTSVRRLTPRAAASDPAVSTATTVSAVQIVQEEDIQTLGAHPRWGDFASRVSGEWDGYGAEFTGKGEPVELPENVVPEAYREWGVQVFDWQTQCPTLAESDEPSLLYKVIRLLPTVGCEADAATRYSIEEKQVGRDDNKVLAFAYHQSGSYVAIWVVKEQGEGKLLELEHCLVDPKDHEIRMRLAQSIWIEKTMPKLQKINVFSEQWYGPFRNGEQLGGCAIRETGFASSDPVEESDVLGTWQSACLSASFQNASNGAVYELVTKKAQKMVRNREGVVMLPKQLWCSVRQKEDRETHAEVGWLVDRGHAVTSRCIFTPDGNLKEIELGQESAVLGDK